MSSAARPIITEHERIRRQRGLSITELARRMGYSRPTVSLIEGGRQKPSPRYRAAAARVLRVPEDLIFTPEVREAGFPGPKPLADENVDGKPTAS